LEEGGIPTGTPFKVGWELLIVNPPPILLEAD